MTKPMPLKTKLKQNEFYCVMCRCRVALNSDDIRFKDAHSSKRKNIPMLKGHCAKCGCCVNKFVPNNFAGDMRRKYGK